MKLQDIINKASTISGDEKVFAELRHSLKPTLIYGCSDYSEIVYKYLKRNKIEVEAYAVDRKYWKENSFIEGMRVECIDDFAIDKYNLVIGFGDVEKSKFLMNNKNLLKTKCYFLWEPVKYYEWDLQFIKSRWESFIEVYYGLADEKSRKTLFELIIAKLNKYCNNSLIEVADGNKHYFNELTFSLDSTNEVFVDCGAYNGDTILQNAAFTERKNKKIYAFEKDSEFIIELKHNIKSLKNVEVINKGNWKEDTTLSFKKNGEISHVNEYKGENTVQVTTIDKAIKDEVTFIKMDIEGSELEALQGAAETISTYMPKLAICCYHKKDDIIQLYQYINKIKNQKKKYNIYLRHHSNNTCETVLYAIPKKR